MSNPPIHFLALLICVTTCIASGRTALAVGPGGTLYLGMPSQLMVQPYVSVEVQNEVSPGVYENLGPSADPETIDILGISVPLYNAHNYLLLDTGANSIMIVDEAAQDLENAGYLTEGLFWEVGVGGYHEYEVSAPYRFSVTGSNGVTHYLDGPSGEGVRIQSNPDSVLAAPIAEGGIAGLVGMPAMTGRVTTLDLLQDGHEFSSDPIETWDIWELIALLAGGTSMETSFHSEVRANPGNRYTVPLDNRISFAAEDGRPDGAPPDSPLPIYADVPFLSANVNCEIDGEFNEIEGTFLLDTGAQFSMISRRTAFALGLDENGNGNLDDEAMGFIDIVGVGGSRSVPMMSVDELRLPTEEGVDMVWHDPSDPSEALGVQFIVLDIFPCGDIDFNGIVDQDDLDIISGNMGQAVPEGDIPSGDIDGDGVISQYDLDIATEQLGESTFIDGIFGIDMITGGTQLTGETLDLELVGTPFFDAVHFDFLDWENGNGALVFDVNSAHAEVTVDRIPGDANEDGYVDVTDLGLLSTNYGAGSGLGWGDGDFNGDGIVDVSDLGDLATNYGTAPVTVDRIPGDANEDGYVDVTDLGLIATNYGVGSGLGWGDGDFNGDGIVDVSDLGDLATNYGTVPTQSVPEPSTFAGLLGLCLTGLWALRRRHPHPNSIC